MAVDPAIGRTVLGDPGPVAWERWGCTASCPRSNQ